jgi:hydroxypyruvate isomerase
MMNRRQAIKTTAVAAAAATVAQQLDATEPSSAVLKGNIHHSVCRWCYKDIPLDTLCRQAKDIGIGSIDLVEVGDFPTLRKYGLICAMVTGVPGMINDGLNQPENHARIAEFFNRTIPIVADAGFPNMICFSGQRRGLSDEEGMKHCADGIRKFIGLAEKRGVTVCMELLNSKVNHPDYMADHTAWGVALCKMVGSERFKLLYDIYHMQIMEGDVIRTIQDHHACIAHYHTGGVPGRHEIDDTQELFYPAIMRAIVGTGFKGWVAQEFVPARPDPIASLREGIHICDV